MTRNKRKQRREDISRLVGAAVLAASTIVLIIVTR